MKKQSCFLGESGTIGGVAVGTAHPATARIWFLLSWLLMLPAGEGLAAIPGTVVAWGVNDSVVISVPSDLSGVVDVAAGFGFSLALKRDGTVIGWGYNSLGEIDLPANLSGVVAIAAGDTHSMALKGDGTVVAWGQNQAGQTDVPGGLNHMVGIAAGTYHSLALKGDGSVVAWGGDDSGQSTVPPDLSGAVAIAAGAEHSLALKSDGTVVAWGFNSTYNFGQNTVPTDLSGVVAIAAGTHHSMALKGDGTVVAWGRNDFGMSTVPSNLNGVVAIAAGLLHSLALKGDGTVVAWGYNATGQGTVPTDLSGVVAIAGGGSHNLALLDDSAPSLFRQPTTQTVVVGATVVLDVGATGIRPMHYQWRKDDTNLTEQTTSRLTLHNVQPTDSGLYSVVVTNWAGSATSHVARLAVEPPYTLMTAADGYGTVTVAPLKARYLQSEVVEIDATPARWNVFSQWDDGLTINPRSILVESNASFTATFLPTTPLETLEFGGVSRLAPIGMPTVFVDGVFIVETNFSARGPATVSLLTTFANATLLFTLDGSDPDVSANLYAGPFVLKKSAMLRAIAYNTDFTQAVQSDPLEVNILPTLTTLTEGGGSVAVDPPAGAYLDNGTAVVTATPGPGWTFLQWLGDATGTNPTTSIPMSRNKCAQAVFGTILSNTVVGSGNVVRSSASEWYPFGTRMQLTAVPDVGNYFALWGNAASGTNNPMSFTVTNANPTVTAVFAVLAANQYALTVVPDGFGEVTATPRGNRYGNGTNVTLTALPDAGQSFLGWSDDANGDQNPMIVTVNQSKVIMANFTKRPSLRVGTCLEGVVEDGFRFTLTGEFGGLYQIQGSTNLMDWIGVGMVANIYGTVQFSDPATASFPYRFYRTVEPR